MRTTVSIDDELLRRARAEALASGRSLGDIVDDGLRVLFSDRGRGPRVAVTLPTFGGSGLRPGVDLEDKDALAELLDLPDERHAAG